MFRHKYQIYLVFLAACAVLLIALCFSLRSNKASQSTDASMAERLRSDTTLASLEFETAVPEKEDTEGSEAAEDASSEPESAPYTVLIGDSRTESIKDNGLWPSDQTFSFYDQVTLHYEELEEAAALHPDKVVFLNGLDDVAVYESAEQALGNYENYILTFQELSPDTKIYVHKVLDVTEAACERLPGLREIPDFNSRLEALCAEKGWTFLDCSEGYSTDLLQEDGIHFTKSWAEPWMEQIREKAGF